MNVIKEKKIELFSNGYIMTITEKNWIKTAYFATPCYIKYQGHMIELHNDYLIYHGDSEYINKKDYLYEGAKFENMLPKLLEFGELLPRDENNNPIFTLTK